MTIKSSKQYDQHAHDQPTQATPWARENGGDTSVADSRGAVNNADPSFPHYGSQDASIRRGYQPGNEAHNVALSRQHMAMNEPGASGGLRPKRLTGEEMDQISPGWTARAYERAQRPDGGNG